MSQDRSPFAKLPHSKQEQAKARRGQPAQLPYEWARYDDKESLSVVRAQLQYQLATLDCNLE